MSPEASEALRPAERLALLELARASIRHGLAHGRPLAVPAATLVGRLAEPGATFVTLRQAGELRGCIGSLRAERPLAVDVAENAYAAAFRDARFAPVTAAEEPSLSLQVSLLSAPEALGFRDEAGLLAQLRPGVDGLIIACGERRATFLPFVWSQLPRAEDFLAALKAKAGLAPDRPCEGLRAWRYQACCVGQETAPATAPSRREDEG